MIFAGCTAGGSEAGSERADEAGPRCFDVHLADAIELNRERRPLYSELTGERSETISDKLILFEQASRVVASRLDDRAVDWQAEGIAILCDELEPISRAPEFVAMSPQPPAPLDSYESHNGIALAGDLTAALLVGGNDALVARLNEEIATLGSPGYNCLLRHFLDSLVRVTNTAPLHEQRALELGVASPSGLLRDFALAQIGGLPIATSLDDRAAPLQAEGVPILCQDVPPIPPLPE